MKELIIDRKIWLHGQKQIDHTGDNPEKASMLHRPLDGKMCCIGIYLNQCGVSKTVLLDKSDATSLVEVDIKLPKQAEWLINTDQYPSGSAYTSNTKDAGRLMTANDGTANEKTIKAIFAKHDVEIKFIGRS